MRLLREWMRVLRERMRALRERGWEREDGISIWFIYATMTMCGYGT